MAAAIVGLTLLGLWIDYRFKTGPVGVLVGAGIGVTGGLYNFIQAAPRMAAERDRPQPPDTEKRDDDHTSDS